MGHPFDLVNELQVFFANTAHRLLVHVFDSLDILCVFQLTQV